MEKTRVTASPARPVLIRKVATFARLPVFTKAWVVPAWLGLGLSDLVIRIVPFRRLSRRLGIDAGPVRLAPLVSPRQRRRAEMIGQTIAIAARYAPFRSDCLRQALVAGMLCRWYRVPYALHLGALIERQEGATTALKAHAWVISGPVAICGGGGTSRYAPLACYVHRRGAGTSLISGGQ